MLEEKIVSDISFSISISWHLLHTIFLVQCNKKTMFRYVFKESIAEFSTSHETTRFSRSTHKEFVEIS